MKLLATIAAVALAAPVAAETVSLDINGYWETFVDFDGSTDEMYCRLENVNKNMTFSHMASGTGTYAIFIRDDEATDYQNNYFVDMLLEFDSAAPVEWTLKNTELSGTQHGVMLSYFWGSEADRVDFFSDFLESDGISLMDGDSYVAGWSLRGAAAGVASFQECISRISGDPL